MANTEESVRVACAADQSLECMKCERRLETRNIAMLIRTRPTDAFIPWCPECTRYVLQLALQSYDGVIEVSIF